MPRDKTVVVEDMLRIVAKNRGVSITLIEDFVKEWREFLFQCYSTSGQDLSYDQEMEFHKKVESLEEKYCVDFDSLYRYFLSTLGLFDRGWIK